MSPTDHWDWARYALGVALVLCNIGVWRGVTLEESNLAGLKEAGKKLLIRSLALEALLAAALFVVDTVASISQKQQIAVLNKTTEDLRHENLKLQAEVVWRDISDKQCRDFGASIALPKQGEKTLLLQYPLGDPEALFFATGIGNCFFHWKWAINSQAIAFIHALPLGLIITGPESFRFTDAYEKVYFAFRNAHFESDWDDRKIAPFTRYGNAPTPPYDVKIIVGSKPILSTTVP